MSVQQQFVALPFTVDVLEKCLLLLHPLLHVTAMMPPAALAQRLSPGGCASKGGKRRGRHRPCNQEEEERRKWATDDRRGLL